MRTLLVVVILGAVLSGFVMMPAGARPPDLVVALTGKVVVQYPNESQKKTVTIVVHKAKTSSGVPFDSLKGKIIIVIGQKADEVGKYDDKEVTLNGTMRDNNSKIEVSSVKKLIPKIDE